MSLVQQGSWALPVPLAPRELQEHQDQRANWYELSYPLSFFDKNFTNPAYDTLFHLLNMCNVVADKTERTGSFKVLRFPDL